MSRSQCRSCGTELSVTFANLGMSPLSNAFVPADQERSAEAFFPLHALVCTHCWLVQVLDFQSPKNIFKDYAYFSSFSDTWVKHCADYSERMVTRLGLDATSKVVEIASNDGTLLKNFVTRGIPSLGIEPADNVAKVARASGVPTESQFFGAGTAADLARRGHLADLMVANNVLAHVPDINDFVEGFRILLKPEGVITFEFPSLHELIDKGQFDTIYHEHFSYLSLLVVRSILAKHGLRVFDVDILSTHGGSLRVYACREAAHWVETSAADMQCTLEIDAGLQDVVTYRSFAQRVVETKIAVLEFLIAAKRDGKKVVGYGAPAKANTLLNYCGIGPDFIEFTVDRNPVKQGTLLPGCRIPVRPPEAIAAARPDYVVIMPWNLRNEISANMSSIREWGGRCVVFIPGIEVLR